MVEINAVDIIGLDNFNKELTKLVSAGYVLNIGFTTYIDKNNETHYCQILSKQNYNTSSTTATKY